MAYPELTYSTVESNVCPNEHEWEVPVTFENGALFDDEDDKWLVCPACGEFAEHVDCEGHPTDLDLKAFNGFQLVDGIYRLPTFDDEIMEEPDADQ